MTEYFMQFFMNEVNIAKRAGQYDCGTRTLTGNKIEVCLSPSRGGHYYFTHFSSRLSFSP